MKYPQLTRDLLDRILAKAQLLDPDDPDRRGILEYAAAWFNESHESRRRKIEREILKRARRLAY